MVRKSMDGRAMPPQVTNSSLLVVLPVASKRDAFSISPRHRAAVLDNCAHATVASMPQAAARLSHSRRGMGGMWLLRTSLAPWLWRLAAKLALTASIFMSGSQSIRNGK